MSSRQLPARPHLDHLKHEAKALHHAFAAGDPDAAPDQPRDSHVADQRARSDRDGAPVLIWPTPVPTARSAMNVSSVSPERCEITDP